MKKDYIVVLVFLYIFFLIFQYSLLYTTVQDLNEEPISAKAAATVSFCFNHPPTLFHNCSSNATETQEYYCEASATDYENSTYTYETVFLTTPTLFNISTFGVINFTPDDSAIGNHTYRLTFWDASGCENGNDHDFINLEVFDINEPPFLIKNISNQTWEQDTILANAFDLDGYFGDPENQTLRYTTLMYANASVDVDIDNSTNVVTFTPISGFTGREYVVFVAWDPYLLHAFSNNVTLRLTSTQEEQEEEENEEANAGSSGSSGGSVPLCIPRWYCTPWGVCEPDSLMRRECYDLNNCSSDFGKPNETEPCEFISTCFDGFKGPEEEDIDCGGPCPPCGTCYDQECNNGEDCTQGLTTEVDCGGPCKPCKALNGTCYDGICNNNEDCTKGDVTVPDCGGPCDPCPLLERPGINKAINWGLWALLLASILLVTYTLRNSYPYLLTLVKKRKTKMYEEKLLLETSITESILDSLKKVEELLKKGNIEKAVVMFSALARKYFKNLFNLEYEFTYEEIMEEINSKDISPVFKSVLQNFFERSIELEFSGKTVSKQEIGAMIAEFRHILSITSKKPIKTSEKETKGIEQQNLTKMDGMFMAISDAEYSLRKKDINTAYNIYMAILKKFNELEGKDQERLHGFVSRLYEELNLAREKYMFEHESKI